MLSEEVDFFKSEGLLSRTDALILMVEAQDPEQVDFVKEVCKKWSAVESLQFLPVILVQTKMDADGVGTL